MSRPWGLFGSRKAGLCACPVSLGLAICSVLLECMHPSKSSRKVCIKAPDKHSPELLLLVKRTCQKIEGLKNLPPVLPVHPCQPARSPTCWGWVGGDLWTPWRSLCCYRGHRAREQLRLGRRSELNPSKYDFVAATQETKQAKTKTKSTTK